MKKTLHFLLVACLCIMLVLVISSAVSADGGIPGEDVSWSYDGEGTLTFTGSGNIGLYNKGGTPWDKHSSEVKRVIVGEGFTDLDNFFLTDFVALEQVSLPSTLTTIGWSAFEGCTSLEAVRIPDNVTSIEKYAFKDCEKLKEINLPEKITVIQGKAFYGCKSLTSVRLPSSLSAVGSQLFEGCTSLKSIYVSDGITVIPEVFAGTCRALEDVRLPETLCSIESRAFENCSGLKDIDISDSVNDIGSYAFAGCIGLESITLPAGIENIESHLLFGCVNLKETMLPEGVKYIKDHAFSGCKSLKEVGLPVSLQRIGTAAFENCVSLETVRYYGASNQFELVAISAENDVLSTATVTYGHEHVYVTKRVEECGSVAHTEHRCGCGYTYTTDYGAYVYHDLEDVEVYAPTCSKDGYTVKLCKKCGYSYNDNIVEALGHVMGDDVFVQEVTCEEDGYTVFTCTVCKRAILTDLIEKVDHSYESTWTIDVPSKRLTPGEASRHCMNCSAKCDLKPVYCVFGVHSMYSDVEMGRWSASGIDFAVSTGLMNGVGDGMFDPDGTLTRAMAVTVLWRLDGSVKVDSKAPFVDIEPDAEWYHNAINWGYSTRVVQGVSQFKFNPCGKVTREELATMIWRFISYKSYFRDYEWESNPPFDGPFEVPFDDGGYVAEWAQLAAIRCAESGLVTGIKTSDGKVNFEPNSLATREQFSVILTRLCEKNDVFITESEK